MAVRGIEKKKHIDLIIVFCSVLCLGAINGLFIGFRNEIFGGGDIVSCIFDVLATAIALGCPILIIEHFTSKKENVLPTSEFSCSEMTKCGLFVLGLGYLFRIGYAFFVSFLAFVQPQSIKNKGFLVLCLYFVSSVVLPAVLEEVLFREKIFRVAEEYKFSVLFTSLLFAFSHTNAHSIVNAFVFGLLLQSVFVRTRRLGYCIIIHFTNNLLAFFSAISDEGSILEKISNSLPYIFAVTFIVYVIVVITGRKKKHEQ